VQLAGKLANRTASLEETVMNVTDRQMQQRYTSGHRDGAFLGVGSGSAGEA
jgi:hypothetical protein